MTSVHYTYSTFYLLDFLRVHTICIILFDHLFTETYLRYIYILLIQSTLKHIFEWYHNVCKRFCFVVGFTTHEQSSESFANHQKQKQCVRYEVYRLAPKNRNKKLKKQKKTKRRQSLLQFFGAKRSAKKSQQEI